MGCDGASGRVTELWLPGRGLAGPFPGASLAGLARLRSLDLANNMLVGTIIPSWIGEFEQLCHLDLSGNSLVDEVPKSLIQLKGLATAGRSMGMACTNMPFYMKRNRRTLNEQPNTKYLGPTTQSNLGQTMFLLEMTTLSYPGTTMLCPGATTLS